VTESPSEPDPLLEADPELLGRLKQWRTEKAHEQGVPPYVVLHDKTLAALASVRPGNVSELLEVKGIGPSKAERFGEAILEILAVENS